MESTENKAEEINTRCRMNLSLTSKGLVQWDCTAEYDTPELAAENISKAIDLVRKAIADKGLQEAGAE